MEIKEEAILEDVSTGEELVPVEVEEQSTEEEIHLSPRDQKMKEIADRRANEISDNSGEVATYDQMLGTAPEEELEEAPEALPFYQNENGDMVMKLKVNGQESERTLDQLISSTQKNESGDQKLQAAHDRSLLLDERERVQQQEHRQLALEREELNNARGQQINPPSEQDAGDDADLDSALDKAIDSLFDGDKQAAADALKPLLTGRDNAIPDVNEIIKQTTANVSSKLEQDAIDKKLYDDELSFKSSLREGVEWLEETYPDVDDSKRLRTLVDKETNVVSAANPNFTPKQVIQAAANAVVKREGLDVPDTSEPSSRQSNKDNMRQPALRAKPTTFNPPKGAPEVDTSDKGVIQRMREQRNAVAGR